LKAAAIESPFIAKDGLEKALRIGEEKVQRLEGNWEQLTLENSELRSQKEALEGEITLGKAVIAQYVAKIAGLEVEITRAHSALEEARQQIALVEALALRDREDLTIFFERSFRQHKEPC